MSESLLWKRPLARSLGVAALVLIVVGLLGAFFYAPPDAVQGEVQRIMYVHVPSAWVALWLTAPALFLSSLLYLWKGRPEWDYLARASAELGVVFTGLAIVTGAIWGKPTWGAWWTWDARLTTTAILFFIYLAYLILRAFSGPGARTARFAAVLGILGPLDVPLIHMSVVWWRTLHQPATVLRATGRPSIDSDMLITLIVNVLGFTVLFLYLLQERAALAAGREELARRQEGS